MFDFFKSLWREIRGSEIPVTIPVSEASPITSSLTNDSDLTGHLTPYIDLSVKYSSGPYSPNGPYVPDPEQHVAKNLSKRPPLWMVE